MRIIVNILYYICRDYLGSIIAITNSSGSLVQELSYNAWGRLRDPDTQEVYSPGNEPTLLLGRGYTGHEHLIVFGLINMNARLYDPALGRFLSPDPYVQSPDFSQNFNRYSYGFNNPLKFTDPSGEFIFSLFLGPIGVILDAACWGSLINGGFYTASTVITGQKWDWGKFGKSLAVGAISGAAGSGAGMLTQSLQIFGAIPGALIEGTIQGAASGLAGGFGNVIIENDWGAFGSGFVQGFVTGVILGGITGGIEGYKNAQGVGANPLTGSLYQNQMTYSTTPKTGIAQQPNVERDCYGYALEYADSGHGNRPASFFLDKGNNAPGAYAGDIARKSGIKVNWSRRIVGAEWDNVGGSLLQGKEILATTTRDGVNHWVNITSVTTADKWRVIGGGWSRVLRSTSVWDPIKGHINRGPLSFLSVLSLF